MCLYAYCYKLNMVSVCRLWGIIISCLISTLFPMRTAVTDRSHQLHLLLFIIFSAKVKCKSISATSNPLLILSVVWYYVYGTVNFYVKSIYRLLQAHSCSYTTLEYSIIVSNLPSIVVYFNNRYCITYKIQ
jgi:hypothetical protein